MMPRWASGSSARRRSCSRSHGSASRRAACLSADALDAAIFSSSEEPRLPAHVARRSHAFWRLVPRAPSLPDDSIFLASALTSASSGLEYWEKAASTASLFRPVKSSLDFSALKRFSASCLVRLDAPGLRRAPRSFDTSGFCSSLSAALLKSMPFMLASRSALDLPSIHTLS